MNPLAEKSARIPASSLILRAKAFFFADTLARVRHVVEVPDLFPSPASRLRASRRRDTARRSISSLWSRARRKNSPPSTPSCSRSSCSERWQGLSRHEIDLLQWRAFLFDEGAIRIETTEHFRPKSPSSEGDIHVDGELLDVFRGFRARAKSDSDFVIESSGNVTAAGRDLTTTTAATASSLRSASGFATTAL